MTVSRHFDGDFPFTNVRVLLWLEKQGASMKLCKVVTSYYQQTEVIKTKNQIPSQT